MNQQDIPAGRRIVFYLGLASVVTGAILFGSTALWMVSRMSGRDIDGPDIQSAMGTRFGIAFGGMILIGFGRFLMQVGARGLAGAGLVLDPQQAREDIEPWSRMGGGMLNDALSEVQSRKDTPGSVHEVVKVRCPSCRALNDEAAKFCDQCGTAI